MIVEVADFKIRPEDKEAFCEALQRGVRDVLSKARGYRRHSVLTCRETAGRVLLLVDWATVEDHTVGFRESPAFGQWRAIVGPFFVDAPHVEHFDEASLEGQAGDGG